MNCNLAAVVFLALSVVQSAVAWQPKSPKDCRLAFLMGMSSIGDPGGAGAFPPERSPDPQVFETVARLYAADIGTSAEDLASGEWRKKVEAIIEDCRRRSTAESWMNLVATFGDSALSELHLPAAYLAGAYVTSGTPTGFRLVNQRKGLYLAWLVRMVFGELTIDARIKPGIPGNITITLSGGGTQAMSDFVEEMKLIRESLSKP